MSINQKPVNALNAAVDELLGQGIDPVAIVDAMVEVNNHLFRIAEQQGAYSDKEDGHAVS